MISILKRFHSKVFIRGIPTDWDHAEMISRFGTIGPISQVYFVRNQQGQNTGKVIMTYEDDKSADLCIARFDD